MINSCSFSVPGSKRHLASACDLATVSISNKIDKIRTRAHTFARLSHYLTFIKTLDARIVLTVMTGTYDLVSVCRTVPESRVA